MQHTFVSAGTASALPHGSACIAQVKTDIFNWESSSTAMHCDLVILPVFLEFNAKILQCTHHESDVFTVLQRGTRC